MTKQKRSDNTRRRKRDTIPLRNPRPGAKEPQSLKNPNSELPVLSRDSPLVFERHIFSPFLFGFSPLVGLFLLVFVGFSALVSGWFRAGFSPSRGNSSRSGFAGPYLIVGLVFMGVNTWVLALIVRLGLGGLLARVCLVCNREVSAAPRFQILSEPISRVLRCAHRVLENTRVRQVKRRQRYRRAGY